MKLIGFTFIPTQKEFEKWQLDNSNFTIHQVQPHLLQVKVKDDDEKYTGGMDMSPKWGVFVTYGYEPSVSVTK